MFPPVQLFIALQLGFASAAERNDVNPGERMSFLTARLTLYGNNKYMGEEKSDELVQERESEERQADKSNTLNRVKNSSEKAHFQTDLKHLDC